MIQTTNRLIDLVARNENEILEEWLRTQAASGARKLGDEGQLRQESQKFLGLLRTALQAANGAAEDLQGSQWAPVREFLENIARSRARQGYTPSETASFVFSLKQPLFTRLRRGLVRDPEALGADTWAATQVLDGLGLYTTEVYQRGRDEVIERQQKEMMELSTPVVELGVELSDVTTKASLATAFAVALERSGLAVQRAPARG